MSKKNLFELNNTDKKRVEIKSRDRKDNCRIKVPDKNKKIAGNPNEYGDR